VTKNVVFFWMFAAGMAAAATDLYERQIAEQERQIQRLEIENSRLRYMLTEAESHQGDPLYGTKVSKSPQEEKEARSGDEEAARVHVVAKGETLSGIASRHGTEVAVLADLNELGDPCLIRPGERLKLPLEADPKRVVEAAQVVKVERAEVRPAASDPALPRSHVIRAGENLYRVSLKYGIELDALLAANPRIDPRRLRVGQRVRLPGESSPMLVDHR
jgi:LysM repeat protein